MQPPSRMQRGPQFRIVVALDLSEYAEIVLEHALDQAMRHTAPDLHFLHVVEHEREDIVTNAKRDLAHLVLDGLDNVGTRNLDWRVRLHIRAGRAHAEIIALAVEIDAHLIVCGRFGMSRAWHPLGTIAQRVLERAHCPLLAVNLIDRPIEAPRQCPHCVAVRAESEGERWFCDEHAAPDHVTLATTYVSPSTSWSARSVPW